MTEVFRNQLAEELSEIGIVLNDGQAEQFYQYYELLTEWNSHVNLTAITEMKDVITKHYVDSLAIKKIILDIDQEPYNIIDVGTGAGFPGIPLKIAFPELKITLLDSLNKRIRFLDEVIGCLGLEGIRAVHGRAEDLGHDKVSRETYDLCVSRAVANIATLSEYCLPFVRTGGYFVSYKSGKVEEELQTGRSAVRKLSGEVEDVLVFSLPNSDERSFVKIKKTGKTGKNYPRKAGLPSKEPIK